MEQTSLCTLADICVYNIETDRNNKAVSPSSKLTMLYLIMCLLSFNGCLFTANFIAFNGVFVLYFRRLWVTIVRRDE